MAEREYVVTATRFDRHTFNEAQTKVVKTESLRRGDKVTMDEADAERLVKTGGLALADQEDSHEPSPEPSTPPAAVSGQTAEQPSGGGADGSEDSTTGQPGASTLSEAGGTVADNYDDATEWSYGDLQQEAKNRDLSAAGSRAEIVSRLREHDEDERAEANQQ